MPSGINSNHPTEQGQPLQIVAGKDRSRRSRPSEIFRAKKNMWLHTTCVRLWILCGFKPPKMPFNYQLGTTGHYVFRIVFIEFHGSQQFPATWEIVWWPPANEAPVPSGTLVVSGPAHLRDEVTKNHRFGHRFISPKSPFWWYVDDVLDFYCILWWFW